MGKFNVPAKQSQQGGFTKAGKKKDSGKPEPGKSKKKAFSESLLKNDEYDQEQVWRDSQVAAIFREGRRRGGRPTKLSEDVMRDAEVLARIGLSQKAIAESLMIGETTLKDWIRGNERFAERLRKARNTGKSILVNSIFGHGRRYWQALAWLLERQYRDEFALDKQKVELSGPDGKQLAPIPTTIVFDFGAEKKPEEPTTTEPQAKEGQ